MVVSLVNDTTGPWKPHPLLRLDGATRVRCRVHGERITLGDDRGRIVLFETASLAHVRTLFI